MIKQFICDTVSKVRSDYDAGINEDGIGGEEMKEFLDFFEPSLM